MDATMAGAMGAITDSIDNTFAMVSSATVKAGADLTITLPGPFTGVVLAPSGALVGLNVTAAVCTGTQTMVTTLQTQKQTDAEVTWTASDTAGDVVILVVGGGASTRYSSGLNRKKITITVTAAAAKTCASHACVATGTNVTCAAGAAAGDRVCTCDNTQAYTVTGCPAAAKTCASHACVATGTNVTCAAGAAAGDRVCTCDNTQAYTVTGCPADKVLPSGGLSLLPSALIVAATGFLAL